VLPRIRSSHSTTMPSLHDLDNHAIPLDRRLALALEFAIGALNDAPSFGTHIASPDTGLPLPSYRVLAKLDTVLAEAKVAFADESANDNAVAAPTLTPAIEKQASLTAKAMLTFYDLLKGQPLHLAQPPVSSISDLIADLMRYARREGIEFSDALAVSYSQIAEERPEHLGPKLVR
jgi:hypothetical protein